MTVRVAMGIRWRYIVKWWVSRSTDAVFWFGFHFMLVTYTLLYFLSGVEDMGKNMVSLQCLWFTLDCMWDSSLKNGSKWLKTEQKIFRVPYYMVGDQHGRSQAVSRHEYPKNAFCTCQSYSYLPLLHRSRCWRLVSLPCHWLLSHNTVTGPKPEGKKNIH